MNQAVKFLKECGTFFLATSDSNRPYVRPFGAIMDRGGKIYICTNNQKKCFIQMKTNPMVEISGAMGDMWIRLSGKVKIDPDNSVKESMLNEYPELRSMYHSDDDIYEVLYFENPQATIYSFSGDPIEIYFN